MSLYNLRNLYQQVILKHYKKPRHRGRTSLIDRSHRGHNPSCGDTIALTVQLKADQTQIEDVKFEGDRTALAADMVQRFQLMMKGDAEFPRDLRKLNVMQGVAQFPVRIKCATLTWHTLKATLELAGTASNEAFISNEDEG
ncbi:MAG: iron-sulfur cluster assembly scaffold protein [Cyanobacteria bacterium P01_F01_bin.42]